MKILGTGLTGLVGSRIVELLSSYSFENLGRAEGVDITGTSSLQRIQNQEAKILLHFAAKTDVDLCEKDKPLGKDGEAWKVNVAATENLVEICKKSRKKIIYISTDFVFDGEKKEAYSEADTPNPVNWYARTKYEGEKIIQNSGVQFIILRLAYPYRAAFAKLDFMRAIKTRLENNQEVKAISDHVFCPTFVDDVARALHILIQKNSEGVFHVVGSSALSPYAAACSIADVFELSKDLISETTRAEYFKDRAVRPFNLDLRNDKISALGVHMKTFEEGLGEVAKQLQSKG